MYYGSFINYSVDWNDISKTNCNCIPNFVLGILVVETGGGVQRRVAAVLF